MIRDFHASQYDPPEQVGGYDTEDERETATQDELTEVTSGDFCLRLLI